MPAQLSKFIDGFVFHPARNRHRKDVLDDGEHIVDEDYCGSCYGAADPDECCNTCEDVKNAYRKKGWSFEGQVTDNLPHSAREKLSAALGCSCYFLSVFMFAPVAVAFNVR